MSHAPLKYGKDDDHIKGDVKAAVERFEDKRRDQKIEYGLLVDEHGHILEEKRGGKHSASMLTVNWEKAVVMTHIHPAGGELGRIGGSFSQQDVNSFIKFPKLETMRAVAKEGTYSLTKGKKFDATGFSSYYKKEHDIIKADYVAKMNSLNEDAKAGRIADYDTYHRQAMRELNAFLSRSHKMILDGQKKYGYTYTLERRKK